MNQKIQFIALVIIAVLLFSACASPIDIDPCVANEEQNGFIAGIIHGFIAPVAFIISLFNDDVTMYAVNNSGTWYDLGFLVGIGGFSGGILKGSSRKR